MLSQLPAFFPHRYGRCGPYVHPAGDQEPGGPSQHHLEGLNINIAQSRKVSERTLEISTNPQNVDPQHPREGGDVRVTADTGCYRCNCSIAPPTAGVGGGGDMQAWGGNKAHLQACFPSKFFSVPLG